MPKPLTLERATLEAAESRVKLAEGRYIRQDPLKKGIEPHIRPVVVALVAHGFPTQNSCEGHVRQNLYPWVRFQPPVTGKIKSDLLCHVRRIHNEVEQLGELLGEFWESRPRVTPDRELQVTPEWNPSIMSDKDVVEEYMRMRARRFVALPGYMLECAGAQTLFTMPDEVIRPYRKSILKHRRQDMRAFGKFLVSKLQ